MNFRFGIRAFLKKERLLFMANLITLEDLKNLAESFVKREPERLGAAGWWQSLLVTAAPIDARFDQLTQIAADDHLHPRDLLPTANSVIVFYLPFARELVQENKNGPWPCRTWGVAYVQTNDLIERLGRTLSQFLLENVDRGIPMPC